MSSDSGWENIKNVSASRLRREGDDSGIARLKTILALAQRGVRWRVWPLAITSIISAIIFLFCAWIEFIIASRGERVLPDWLQVTSLVFLLLFLGSGLMIYLMQQNQLFRALGRLAPACYPIELEKLFTDLRSGAWEARTSKGLLPSHLFESEWRTLLASGPETYGTRFWVRDKYGGYFGRDIEVREVPTIVFKATSLQRNKNVESPKTTIASPIEVDFSEHPKTDGAQDELRDEHVGYPTSIEDPSNTSGPKL